MDAFKFNWTQRIKTEPFVNATLNSKGHTDKPYAFRYWRPINEPQNINSWREASRTNYTKSKTYTDDADRERKYGFHRTGIQYYDRVMTSVNKNPTRELRNIEFINKPTQDPDIWENTRPQSLYNLRYACLR